MRIFDITRPIRPEMTIYPGDPEVSFKKVACISTDGFSLHSISLGTHTGTHVDAPAHLVENGITVDKLAPDILVGRALVCETGDVVRIDIDCFKGCTGEKRVLIKTDYRSRNINEPPYLSLGAAKFLIEGGTVLLGMDTPSPDTPWSLDCHKILLDAGVVLVENLDLTDISAGIYYLYCLPLLLSGLDGAPARVFLVQV
ncbi:MAG: cyclase family protein [Bacillota bacterium]